MKVTNYGLGGLVEDHNDPYGYNEGAPVPPERADLVHSGDIIATVMGQQNVTLLHESRYKTICFRMAIRHQSWWSYNVLQWSGSGQLILDQSSWFKS